jgi:formylglycine-generating enzyme required for sulfatase activity
MGYRLATQAEWVHACLAGAQTEFCYGEPEELMSQYGWCMTNSGHRCHPVGLLKPNDLGLFDMHGNASELCDDVLGRRPAERLLLGGGCNNGANDCKVTFLGSMEPSMSGLHGVRVVRVLGAGKARK